MKCVNQSSIGVRRRERQTLTQSHALGGDCRRVHEERLLFSAVFSLGLIDKEYSLVERISKMLEKGLVTGA